MDCSICCERYNGSSLKMTTCPFCGLDCCRSCQKTYLLASMDDPHCMKCKKGFTIDIMDTIFNRHFRLGEWKRHREQVLFEREKSLLPATQPHVEVKIAQDNMAERIQELMVGSCRSCIHTAESMQVMHAFILQSPCRSCIHTVESMQVMHSYCRVHAGHAFILQSPYRSCMHTAESMHDF